MLSKILLNIFLWSGGKLFHYVTIYEGKNGNVLAIHFGVTEESVIESCNELAKKTE